MATHRSLLECDLVMMDQLEGWTKADFDIVDAEGLVVGKVRGTDSGASRFWRGPRNFEVIDADGTILAELNDVYDWGRDTYQVTRGENLLAEVTHRLRFFSRWIQVAVPGGRSMSIEGNFFDREFTVVDEATDELVATGSREHVGLARAFFGQDRYGLSFTPRLSRDERLALIGAMVALELIRRKENKRASNTASNS